MQYLVDIRVTRNETWLVEAESHEEAREKADESMTVESEPVRSEIVDWVVQIVKEDWS